MLRIAINEANALGGSKLRAVAEALVDKALTGDVHAINTIADRLDGKVPQAHVGSDDHPGIGIVTEFRRTLVNPQR